MKKGLLSFATLFVSFLVVYGVAALNRMFEKGFLLENGWMDVGYLFLTLSIACPVVLYILFKSHTNKENIIKISLFGIGIATLLFVPVYLTIALENAVVPIQKIHQFSIILVAITSISTMIAHFEWKYAKR